MKKVFTVMSVMALAASMSTAYSQNDHPHSGCGNNYIIEMNNPAFAKDMEKFNNYVKQMSELGFEKDGNTKIIPVVVHVIHDGGSSNVSEASINQMITIMNKNYSRQAANIGTLPARFDSIAGNVNFEFRLAKRDPFGNCTNGIRRVYAPTKTNDAYDDMGFKKLSYWDRAKYLNIWLVNNIVDPKDAGANGQILGYCLFPGSAPALRDGATIDHSVITLQGVVSHEIGHHFSLIHIWGDEECGDDEVDDTPISKDVNFAWPNNPCATAIKPATCYDTIAGDSITLVRNKHMYKNVGENYQNFMDYVSNYNCPNMFTYDQIDRMRAAQTFYSFRANVVSAANLTATGVADGTPACSAIPVPEFWAVNPIVCPGVTVNFKDGSFNATPTSWAWEFEGGTPASSTAQNPNVTYDTPGVYRVRLTSSNAAGGASKTKEQVITVLSTSNEGKTWGFQETFEDGWPFAAGKWSIVADPDLSKSWTLDCQTGYNGSCSIKMNNFNNVRSNMSTLISPSINMDAITGGTKVLRFKMAYAKRTAETFAYNETSGDFEAIVADKLVISRTSNCGSSWVPVKTYTGEQLVSAGLDPNAFAPNSKDLWQDINISVQNATGTDVKFKFEFFSGGAFNNNLYIDDINIYSSASTSLSIDEVSKESIDLNIFPNPVTEISNLTFNLPTSVDGAIITVHDMMGRTVAELYRGNLQSGIHNFNISKEQLGASGMYFVRLNLEGKVLITEKILTK